jgi:glycosyltransferase involved in cell wall biosynthesis
MRQVSFVIIAFNESAGIQKCIASILGQKTKIDYEIILIDDGSIDSTAEIVKQAFGSKVHVHSQKNLGRGRSRFNGVQIAKAPFIAMVDGDIVLPENWLETCFANFENFSAVGGIAVPDGDCSTIHRLLSLKAKTVVGSVAVTGNNILIKKSALLEMGNSWVTPLGEDFRLNQLLRKKNHKVSCIPTLLVSHNENKTYRDSLKWLFKSGVDATRLAFEFKTLRRPDLAFIVWVITLLFALISFIGFHSLYGLLLLLLVNFSISIFHFYSKFNVFQTPLRSILGILLNVPLIASYLFGRLFGLVVIGLKR